ncbi:MAG TPA: DUF1801 domain-containing protein [Propionibacteriaceae bacterium]|nr:DUF1801 domain-containing protein [Propionibacteriaceae bacterium]
MGELKTKENDSSVTDFLDAVDDQTKRQDSYVLLDMYRRATGEEPRMWGESIIGFGKYHYKSERSTQEGDWPLAAFSPRKQNLTLYFMLGFDKFLAEPLSRLGKHTTSKSCLYINKLADVDVKVLEETVREGFTEAKQKLS